MEQYSKNEKIPTKIMDMDTHTHTHIYTYIYTHIRTRTHIHVCVHINVSPLLQINVILLDKTLHRLCLFVMCSFVYVYIYVLRVSNCHQYIS